MKKVDIEKLYYEKKLQLENFRQQYGCKSQQSKQKLYKIQNYLENNQQTCLYQQVIDDVVKNYEILEKQIYDEVNQKKKIAKSTLKIQYYKKEMQEKQFRNKLRKQLKQCKEISNSVYKFFWSNSFKFLKIKFEKLQKEKEKKIQQEQLNNFLQLQEKLTDQIYNDLQSTYINLKEFNNKDTKGSLVINLKRIQGKLQYLNVQKYNYDDILLFKGKLRQYQKVGVRWLETLNKTKISGILADEMGLGKTVQTIAHFCNLAENHGIWGPHLIIVPTSVVDNWAEEFHRFFPGFKVFTYYGKSNERKLKRKGWTDLNMFNVCITTYRIANIDKKIFKRKRWYCLVLDEAHLIKNSNSQGFQSLTRFKAIHRILLTGTPLQNKLQELWTLMQFLFPQKFYNTSQFCENFDIFLQKAAKNNATAHDNMVKKLHEILRPLILRRLKKEVEKQLPKKIEKVIRCNFSRRQKYLYDHCIMNKRNRKKQNNIMQRLNVLMELKKICNHPDLVDQRIAESPMVAQQIDYYLPSFIQFIDYQKQQYNICVQNNMQNENIKNVYQFKKILLHVICELHFKFKNCINNINHDQYKSLLRQKISRIKSYILTQKFEPIYIQYKYQNKNTLLYFIQPKVLQKNLYVFENIKNMCRIVQQQYNLFLFQVQKVVTSNIRSNLHINICSQYKNKLRQHIISPLQYIYLNNINEFINDSGKLQTLYKILLDLQKQNRKVVIFTQMTKMLNLLEIFLSYKGFYYIRLDGSIATEKRHSIVIQFNTNSKIMVFISSTRVGGIGINLVSADTVIFYDSDWNPSIDKQAQDRCHRIGQTRDVTIYRLITRYSIEENILTTSNIKSKIDDIVMNQGRFTLQRMFQIFWKNQNISIEEKEKKMIQYLTQVEDKDDQVLDDYLEDENNSNSEDSIDYNNKNNKNEIHMIEDLMPPIYKYGLNLLQSKLNIDDNQYNLIQQEKNQKTQEQQQELKKNNKILENKQQEDNNNYQIRSNKVNMNISQMEKNEMIINFRKQLQIQNNNYY